MIKNLSFRQAVFGAALTSFIMGGFIVASRFGVRDVISAADLTFFRYLSGILLLPIFLKRPIRNLGGVGWGKGIVITILAGWVFNMLLVSGFRFAPAAHGAVFGPGTMPMFTVLFSWILFGDKIGAWRIGGLAVLATGLIMLGWGGFLGSTPDAWKGDLLFLGGAACWGGFAVSIRYWQVDPVYAVAMVGILSLVSFTPIYFLFYEPAFFTDAPMGDILFQMFYQAVLVGSIAVVLFTISIPVLGPSRTALFMALVPVFGTLMGIPILGEFPGPIETGGIVLVVLGVLAAMGVKPPGRKYE